MAKQRSSGGGGAGGGWLQKVSEKRPCLTAKKLGLTERPTARAILQERKHVSLSW